MTRAHDPIIRLDPNDNVVVAHVDITKGTEITNEDITSRDAVSFGKKIARRNFTSKERAHFMGYDRGNSRVGTRN